MTYARALRLSFCWRLDHILLTAVGMIHATAMQALAKIDFQSASAATATPVDITVSARALDKSHYKD